MTFVKPDGYEICLACWKDWMQGGSDRDLGMKTMSSLKRDSDGRPDIYEAQQETDQRIALATDAMINSLSRLQISAIYRSCSIASVWKFPNADFAEVAATARHDLINKLRNNSLTEVLF